MNIVEFESHTFPITETGCWIWTMGLTGAGYGHCGLDLAHRVSYRLYKGDIPKGKFILHSCDVRCCVNPAHLRAGNQSENIRDAVKRGRHFGASQTHCKNGHEFTIENTLIRSGKRSCKICQYESTRNSYRRRKCKE